MAGQWLAADESIPMTALQTHHGRLNQQCRAQAYSLRSAFFDWLGHSRGDTAVLEASRQRPAGGLADYDKFFEASLADLDTEWQKALLATYMAIPEVEEQTRAYREDSPIQYQNVCIPGTDF